MKFNSSPVRSAVSYHGLEAVGIHAWTTSIMSRQAPNAGAAIDATNRTVARSEARITVGVVRSVVALTCARWDFESPSAGFRSSVAPATVLLTFTKHHRCRIYSPQGECDVNVTLRAPILVFRPFRFDFIHFHHAVDSDLSGHGSFPTIWQQPQT